LIKRIAAAARRRLVVRFEHEADARRFWEAMRKRLEEFSLSLHPDKTRLIEFGRHAAANRAQRGLGKPETFKFLGFIFICGWTRKGQYQLKRKSRLDRMRAKHSEVKEELWRRMHQAIPEQGVGWRRSFGATLPITPCRLISRHSAPFATMHAQPEG
jgi:hypothetical protein